MTNRYNLESLLVEERKPIDAGWSPRKKKIVVGVAISVAAIALGGGAWAAFTLAPPGLPKTAQEAVAVMGSSKFARLSPDRQMQYADEARHLLSGLSEEDRRLLLRDSKNREALQQMREQLFDEMAHKLARGEKPEFPDRGQRRPPDGQQRPPREQLSQEERDKRMEEFRKQANDRMNAQVQTGNAQNAGLRAEMMKSFGRGGMGGGQRGGGGGNRGGGGGGGGAPRGG